MAKKTKRRKADVGIGSANPPAVTERTTPLEPTAWLVREWRWILLLILAVILAYLPVWRAGFTWDDDMFISSNPCVVGPLGLKEIWTTSAARFYPLVLTTFWLEHAIWGLAPLPYHVVNILLHATCALVLWRTLENLGVRGAWMGAALWALHPVQVETVAWVSEMKNTESCLFFLLTIFFFVRGLGKRESGEWPRARWNYPLAFLCSALAMASKSSTLLLPVVLALCAWWVKGRCQWRDMAKVGVVLLIAIVAALLTSQTVKQNGTDEMQWSQTWQERLVNGGDVFWFYLGKLIWPHPLVTFYPRWQVDANAWISYLPIATVVLVPVALWFQRRKWSRACFFAFAYYLVNLLPVMGMFSMTGFRYSLVEDHLQYLASMGPLALAGAGLAGFWDLSISRKAWLPYALGGALLLLLGTLSWRQSWIYQNEHTLWTYNLSENPDSWLAYDGLAVELVKNGRVDEAIPLYQRSIAINPNYAVTHANLGVALAQEGRTQDAILEYQRSLAINPNSAMTHLKLGEIRLEKGEAEEAVAEDQRALELESDSIIGHDNLGLALVQTGRLDDAIAQYLDALKIDPDFALARNNLGVAFFQKGDVADAIAQYRAALKGDPGMAQAHSNLGLALAQAGISLLSEGRLDEAIAQFQEALRNDPNIAQAHTNLGIALAQKGQLDESLVQFQEALRLRPDDDAAQANLDRIKAMIQDKASSP